MYDTSRVYQHGTLALLAPGLFTGTQSVNSLLQHGDFGIGTADGLAGELIIIKGQTYLVEGSGKVRRVESKEMVPFATVHFQSSHAFKDRIQNINKKNLEEYILTNMLLKNLFFAITLSGTFSNMHTRAVEKQKIPYPNLTSATRVQPEFTAKNVAGTLVGYYAPALYHGAAVSGYHVHFLNTDKTFGGHILNYEVEKATLTIQPFSTFEQHFPSENTSFLKSDFDLSSINKDIEEAEH